MIKDISQNEIQELGQLILDWLLAQSQGVGDGDVDVVDTLTNINSLLAYLKAGSQVKIVEAPLSLLQVEIQRTGTHLQWRLGKGSWQNMIPLIDLMGKDFKFSDFTPDQLALLTLTFDKLTAAEKDSLKLKFSDLTTVDIALLQKPATAAATEVRQEMTQIIGEVNQAIEAVNAAKSNAETATAAANTAAGLARTAAENVKDGKTPLLGIGSVESGLQPGATVTTEGTDESGTPRYALSFILPQGEEGKAPVIEYGTTTTGEPGTEASAELTPCGQTSEGNPKYTLNLILPRGNQGLPGTGSGNVSAQGSGLVAGKQYMFVPSEDGVTKGHFIEYTKPDIPSKTSDLTNNSGFITKSINDLTNYYLKSQTYTKEEVQALLTALNGVSILVVETLPGTGVSNLIYFIPKTASANNIYNEYVWINGKWELIGSTEVDLSNYYTKPQVDSQLTGKVDRAGDTMTGSLNISDLLNPLVKFNVAGTAKGEVGCTGSGVYLYNWARQKTLEYRDNGSLLFEGNGVWHTGNDGAGSGLDADRLDGLEGVSYLYKSHYANTEGVFVMTDILATDHAMVHGRITGNSYDTTSPIDTTFQFYNYPSGNIIIQATARHNGFGFGNIKVFNYNGFVCLWLPNFGPYKSYSVFVTTSNLGSLFYNRVSSIGNSAMLTAGVTRLVEIKPVVVALTSSNVATATKLQATRSFWGNSFDGTSDVDGHIYPGLTDTYNLGSESYKWGNVYSSGWYRTYGSTGWYCETYGGGIHMSDSSYVRTYNQKAFLSTNTSYYSINSLGGFYTDTARNNSWNNGFGALNVKVADNESQTPLIVCASNESGFMGTTAATRNFSMEVLNNGATVQFAQKGVQKISFYLSSSKIAATTFEGSLTGNAATATKLQIHRLMVFP